MGMWAAATAGGGVGTLRSLRNRISFAWRFGYTPAGMEQSFEALSDPGDYGDAGGSGYILSAC